MNIANLLLRTARTYPKLPALAYGNKITANYQEFDTQSAALAGALRGELGLGVGDRVALIMKNHPEYWIALFAIWRAGLVAVPVNAKLHINEFRYILENSDTRICFATAELADQLTPLINDLPYLEKILSIHEAEYQNLKQNPALPLQSVAPDDLAWLFYTSGTTGKPKGAMITHSNVIYQLNCLEKVLESKESDEVLCFLPLCHVLERVFSVESQLGVGNVVNFAESIVEK